MERLGLGSGLISKTITEQGIQSRKVFPLTFGLEFAERQTLIDKYFSGFSQSHGHIAATASDGNLQITQYLRRYGGLTGL